MMPVNSLEYPSRTPGRLAAKWMSALLFISAILFLAPCSLYSQPFTDIGASLPDVQDGALAWGDYDSDGDLDLLLTGGTSSGAVSRIYRNDSGAFVNINASLVNVDLSGAAWGDYDSDGDLDVILTGRGAGDTHQTRLYQNNNGTFNEVSTSLPGLLASAVAWGDYDNDGDLDLVITGRKSNLDNAAAVYRNESGAFVETSGPLAKLRRGALAWGDYDNDGDLDLVMTGRDDAEQRQTKIYRNDEGSFVDANISLPALDLSSVDWGDYDEDGDLDLLLAGTSNSGFVSEVYRNTNGSFSAINAGLPPVEFCALRWGDYDNDGDLDILLSGADGSGRISRIYRNNGSSFSNINAGLTGLAHSAAAWADYDGDGDLDIVLTGNDDASNHTLIYQNGNSSVNNPPTPPTNLTITQDGNRMQLSWLQATDSEMDDDALTYNVRIGSSPGLDDVAPAQSLQDGTRKLAAHGNAFHNLQWTIGDLPVGQTFYWSVQAIDGGFLGSTFAAESQFVVNAPNAVPVAGADEFDLSGFVPARIDVLANDTDTDGDPIRVISVDNPTLQGGVAFVGIDGTAIHYIPRSGFFGVDTFNYTISDGRGATASGQVQVTVLDIAPIAVSMPDTSGIAGETMMIPVRVGDLDSKNVLSYTFEITYDPSVLRFLDVVAVGTVSEGKLVDMEVVQPLGDVEGGMPSVLVGSLSADAFVGEGTLVYLEVELLSPGNAELGFADFFFNEGHPVAELTSGSLEIIAQINANSDEATVFEDNAVVIDVLQNDTHRTGDPLVIGSVVSPQNGSVVIDSVNQLVVYTPVPNFNGVDFFEYSATAADGFSDFTFVSVNVLPVNDAPSVPVILSPAAGETVFLGASQGEDPLPASTLFSVEWADSVDPDGDDLSYVWTLALNSEFTDPVLSLPVNASPMETRVGDVVEGLRDQGVMDFVSTMAYHRVAVLDQDTTVFGEVNQINMTIGALTGVSVEDAILENTFALYPGYPNPFQNRTTLTFSVPGSGTVQLSVFDILGRRVAILVDGHLSAGHHESLFDASGLPGGMYWIRLAANGMKAQMAVIAAK